jgi:hypothetical protein
MCNIFYVCLGSKHKSKLVTNIICYQSNLKICDFSTILVATRLIFVTFPYMKNTAAVALYKEQKQSRAPNRTNHPTESTS